jgi:O-methyltransferase
MPNSLQMYHRVRGFLKRTVRTQNVHPYSHAVHGMRAFNERYQEGLKRTGTKDSIWRRDRDFTLINALDAVRDIEGDIAECGVWKGLSSYLINCHLREQDPTHRGQRYHIFDSFEGLSEPTEPGETHRAGDLAHPLDGVRDNLSDFPDIQYHPGWIPDSFKNEPDRTYRFVHIDVDLPEPTVAAFTYFVPRVATGGLVICDDYGSMGWVGTKDAVDAFVREKRVRALHLSTGQLIVLV